MRLSAQEVRQKLITLRDELDTLAGTLENTPLPIDVGTVLPKLESIQGQMKFLVTMLTRQMPTTSTTDISVFSSKPSPHSQV